MPKAKIPKKNAEFFEMSKKPQMFGSPAGISLPAAILQLLLYGLGSLFHLLCLKSNHNVGTPRD